MNAIDLESTQATNRVMDWHDQILIPAHLRHSVGMDHFGPYGEVDDEGSHNLLILRDSQTSGL